MSDLSIGITYESGWSNTPHYLTDKIYWLWFDFKKPYECKSCVEYERCPLRKDEEECYEGESWEHISNCKYKRNTLSAIKKLFKICNISYDEIICFIDADGAYFCYEAGVKEETLKKLTDVLKINLEELKQRMSIVDYDDCIINIKIVLDKLQVKNIKINWSD